MRLPIISLAVFAVCFVLPCCTNAKSLQSNETENFLLFETRKTFYTLRNPTKDAQISNVEIEDYNKSFETYYSNDDFTFNCANKNIYVLKSRYIQGFNSFDRALDVIHYNGNNKFERINQVKNIFDNAKLIASDWTTGMLYWVEDESNHKYSIKRINQSFIYEPEYIIHSQDNPEPEKLHVYPKKDELFFLSHDQSLWYSSNKPNSTARLLLASPPKYNRVIDFSIDYATDKLYYIAKFKDNYVLYYIDIGYSARPFDMNGIYRIKTLSTFPFSLVAFNNTFYWTTLERGHTKLYFDDGNKKVFEGTYLSVYSKLSFVSSTCPNSTDEKKE